jgi:hypothetical protein
MTPTAERHRVGQKIDDLCRACKMVRDHTVFATGADGTAVRVVCDYCGSQHNYRGGGGRGSAGASGGTASPAASSRAALPIVGDRESSGPAMGDDVGTDDLERMLRRVIREEAGVTPVAPAEKWRGGEIVLRAGKPGLADKTWPIETLFHKVVMIRNRLRVLEQKINASDLPADTKLELQAYITGCYGSLTSFNVLFAGEEDRFRGSGGD